MQDALTRYFDHCADDETRQLLAPITRQEIHARLLLGPHGVNGGDKTGHLAAQNQASGGAPSAMARALPK